MLAYLAGNVGPCCSYVGLCWPHVDSCWAKRSEKWEQQRNTVKRRIFWWSAAYLGAILGLCWPILRAMWAHLGAMLAHLGAMLAHLGAMLAHPGAILAHLGGHVGPSWGLCWPILTPMLARVDPSWATRSEKCEKTRRAQNTVKRGGFGRHAVYGGRGRGPSLLRRGDKRLRQCHGQGAPGRIKRLRATAGQGPNYVAHFVAMLAYVGLSCGQCGPILWLGWPMLASGWFMLSQKIRKMGTAKKHCKTQEIFMVGGQSWGYVGPSWGHVGLSWRQCGPILGLCWPILGLCGPILELCWPILGLCWPILGAMLPHLEAYVGPSWGLSWPMLTHLKPQDPKNGKKCEEHKTP